MQNTIQQRLARIESAIGQSIDTRAPLLLKFIGGDDELNSLAGILYVYDGVPASTYNLTSLQLAEYEASRRNGTAEIWLDTVPCTSKTAELEQTYNKESDLRTDTI